MSLTFHGMFPVQVVSDMGLVDYEQITDETWRRWNAAADDPTHPMRLFTVATVNELGGPDARLLLLRGASRELGCLWFHTNRRSKKVLQLVHDPHVCGLAYDHRDGVQLRVWGKVSLHDDDDLADRHWEQTDFLVRHAEPLSWVEGQQLPQRDPRWDAHRRKLKSHQARTVRQDFVVLQLEIDRIEWQQVSELGDRRAIVNSANHWQIEPLSS